MRILYARFGTQVPANYQPPTGSILRSCLKWCEIPRCHFEQKGRSCQQHAHICFSNKSCVHIVPTSSAIKTLRSPTIPPSKHEETKLWSCSSSCLTFHFISSYNYRARVMSFYTSSHPSACGRSFVPPGAKRCPCPACLQRIVEGYKGRVAASIARWVATVHPGRSAFLHDPLISCSEYLMYSMYMFYVLYIWVHAYMCVLVGVYIHVYLSIYLYI